MDRWKEVTEARKIILNFHQQYKKFKNDGIRKIPHRLLGPIGELYVLSKLKEEIPDIKDSIIYKGGSSSYDIIIKTKKREFKIEVKTSALKNAKDDGIGIDDKTHYYWGWPLQKITKTVKKRGKKKKYDFIICVGVNENYSNPVFYIFNYDCANGFKPVKMSRYGKVKKLMIFKNLESLNTAKNWKDNGEKLMTLRENEINKNKKKYQDWKTIKDELKKGRII